MFIRVLNHNVKRVNMSFVNVFQLPVFGGLCSKKAAVYRKKTSSSCYVMIKKSNTCIYSASGAWHSQNGEIKQR